MKPQRAPYAIVSPETWELARAAYLSGLSASVVAARFGITVHGLRKKAGKEGWTKMAYARVRAADAAEADGEVTAAAPEPPLEPREVLAAVMRQAGAALMKGQGIEAQALVRAAEGYMRLDQALEVMAHDPREEGIEALKARVAALRAQHLAEEAAARGECLADQGGPPSRPDASERDGGAP